MVLLRPVLTLLAAGSVAAFSYVAANGSDAVYRLGSASALTGSSILVASAVGFIASLILLGLSETRR